jgi:DNA-binding Lrp family transcriptional regulator
MIPGHWFWLDKAVIRDYQARIGPSAFSVYCFLASCVDRNQMCFPSQGYIACGLGCSRSTVSRAIEELESSGLIRRSLGAGGRTDYHLSAIPTPVAVDNRGEDCTGATGVSHECTADVAPVDSIYKQRERDINNVVSLSSLAEELAEALRNPEGTPIYEAYTRKYPEEVLRRVLKEVRETPDRKILKSRAHLFTYLLKKYV